MSEMTNEELKHSIAELRVLIKKHGPQSEQVRKFVASKKTNSEHTEFEKLAATLIFLADRIAR